MRSFVVIPVLLGFLFIIGCGSGEERDDTPVDEYTTETISLETIQCQMCAATVQQAASNVEGVERVDVHLEGRVGTVSFNADKASLKDIELAIAKTGYHANDTKRDENVYLQLPACCR